VQRFHVIERESWNKTLSNQVSSAATPISLVSVATEKMSQNRSTCDVSKPSWLTAIKVQTIRLSLLAAVASGIAIIAVSPPKTAQAQEYAWCLFEEGALDSTLQYITSRRREG